MAGIVDWDLKKDALKRLLAAFTDGELVKAVAGNDVKGDAIVQNGLVGKWANHQPTQYRWFFEQLLRKLRSDVGCSDQMTLAVILNASYGEFLDKIPYEKRGGLPKQPINGNKASSEVSGLPGSLAYHPIYLAVGSDVETIEDGVRRGRVDQRHYYLSPESARRWMAVISSRAYPTYEECFVGLKTFVKGDAFQRFLASAEWEGVVMLGGGGAPSKDSLIITRLLSYAPSAEPIRYSLVDISFYMLEQSLNWLDANLRTLGKREKVEFQAIRCDFMDLRGVRSLLRREGKRIAWFLTGQTLGNIDEKKFFASVREETKSGDLLTVGTEFVDDIDDKEELKRLEKKLDNDEVRDFLRLPVQLVCSVLDDGTRLDEALRRIKVRIVDGFARGHSTVPGTQTVEVYVTLPGREITLVTSTRYDEAKLIEFAGGFGFRHAETTASPDNQNYRHISFVRE